MAESKTLAYVSIADQHRIAVLAHDPATGEFSIRSEVKLTGTPGSLCIDPTKKFLYAAIRSADSVATLEIDSATGSLTHLETVSVGLNQTYLSTDSTGRFLFGASYSGGKIAVHRITSSGLVVAEPLQTIATDRNAHSIILDPSERFVFVPHTGPDAIYQFRFDKDSGNLPPNSPPTFTTPKLTGPRHLKFHPKLPLAYTANEQGSSSSVYRLKDDGTLEHRQTLSTLPADFQGENTCAEVKIHPSGRTIYVSNRGHDSLACYLIDSETGLLTLLGIVPTEKTPRSFDISADGKTLAAAGQDSGRLAVYNVAPDTGLPALKQTLDIRGNLSWVSLISLD